MGQTQNLHISAAPQSPDMPRRQGWNADDILPMGADYTYAEAAKEIMFLWNEWADSAENILHKMIDHMEESDISYDDYLTLVRQLAAYPKRPLLPAANFHERPGNLLGRVWNEWADAVERLVNDMKRAIERSVPLPREEQVLCADGPIDFSLDLSNQHPPPMHMAAHLRKMLIDGTVARDELVDFIEDLNI